MNYYNDYLRVAALPLAIEWADKENNFENVRTAFQSLPPRTDVVVLPELFSTGYSDDEKVVRDLAETVDGPTMDFIRRLAARYSVAVAGSFLASEDGKLFNRAFFIEPNSDETYYDKRHLFSLSRESKIFAQGCKEIPSVRFRGWNISMIVCYDLRFPAWCRLRKSPYDLLLVPANWPQARAYAWEHLLIARAIENQCCVVGANRSGEDCYGTYNNLSYIFDGRGMPVGHTAGPFVVADLSRQKQDDYRRNFPVFNDADDFEFLPL